MPLVAGRHDRSPFVMIGVFDFAKRSRIGLSMRVRLLHAINHFLKALDLRLDVFTAGFRPLDSEAKLKVFFIADEHVGDARDFGENCGQLLLAPFPKRGAVIQVEGNPSAMFLRRARQLETELRGLG
jgi:hypothetical protein